MKMEKNDRIEKVWASMDYEKLECIKGFCENCGFVSDSYNFYSEIADKPMEAKIVLCEDCYKKIKA